MGRVPLSEGGRWQVQLHHPLLQAVGRIRQDRTAVLSGGSRYTEHDVGSDPLPHGEPSSSTRPDGPPAADMGISNPRKGRAELVEVVQAPGVDARFRLHPRSAESCGPDQPTSLSGPKSLRDGRPDWDGQLHAQRLAGKVQVGRTSLGLRHQRHKGACAPCPTVA